ncbi:MAG: hypothetical protein EPO22_05355 [Dehalococcoidia bacterium]|nr:MAG: hypothetical protein EPO22_05355 [Dehalococcoidia bacterium]
MPTNTPLHELIRAQTAQYIAGATTLESFRENFLRLSWDVDESQDFQAQTESYAIEHLFSELSSGTLSEDSFRRALVNLALPMVKTSNLNVTADPPSVNLQPLRVA